MRLKAILLTFLVPALFLAVLLGVTQSQANPHDSFTVDSPIDAVDATPGDGICATAGGDCTLRAAIQEANALTGTDTINLPAGIYTLTITGSDEDEGASGDLDIKDDLIIIGESISNTVVNGNGSVINDRVFDIIGTPHVLLSNVTIKNGRVPEYSDGGGLRNTSGTVELVSVAIRDNTGPFMEVGGGISNGGHLTLTQSVVANNVTYSAGGISSYAGSMHIISSTISYNEGEADDVGGIQNNGFLSITQSSVISNSGGGIHNTSVGLLTLVNCTVSKNWSGNGNGGISNIGLLNLVNTTIAMNKAGNGGDAGGLYNHVSGTVTATNVIIAGNVHPGSETTDCAGTIHSISNNLVQNTSGCILVGNTENTLTNVDPKLGLLQDNGGNTWTHALLTGSPAIDAGINDGCPTTDQRGVLRPQDGNGDHTATCDIGAYEYQFPILSEIVYLPLVHKNNPIQNATEQLAFASSRDGNLEIYLMNSDGGAVERLTNHPADDISPNWSPDGQQIVFASKRSGYYEVFIMNADGTNPNRLTFGAAVAGAPAWSPDGTKIAFNSDKDGDSEIYIVNTDGSNLM